jgi:hypothetical protein
VEEKLNQSTFTDVTSGIKRRPSTELLSKSPKKSKKDVTVSAAAVLLPILQPQLESLGFDSQYITTVFEKGANLAKELNRNEKLKHACRGRKMATKDGEKSISNDALIALFEYMLSTRRLDNIEIIWPCDALKQAIIESFRANGEDNIDKHAALLLKVIQGMQDKMVTMPFMTEYVEWLKSIIPSAAFDEILNRNIKVFQQLSTGYYRFRDRNEQRIEFLSGCLSKENVSQGEAEVTTTCTTIQTSSEDNTLSTTTSDAPSMEANDTYDMSDIFLPRAEEFLFLPEGYFSMYDYMTIMPNDTQDHPEPLDNIAQNQVIEEVDIGQYFLPEPSNPPITKTYLNRFSITQSQEWQQSTREQSDQLPLEVNNTWDDPGDMYDTFYKQGS